MSDLDDMNHIRIFLCRDNACGKGNWQCIGYFGKQHIAAFGWSPQEALDKAMTEMESRLTLGSKQQEINLEDMFG
jgi:hypothetical protein